MHDAMGGAEFVATRAEHVVFEAGTEHLACLSLSEKGLLRWYAACCSTPIANTTRDWKFSYVGLIHTCLKADAASFERSFPKLQMRVNTSSARQSPQRMLLKTAAALLGFMPRVIASRVSGSYRRTPFFASPAGSPIVEVYVLSEAETERAYSGAQGASA